MSTPVAEHAVADGVMPSEDAYMVTFTVARSAWLLWPTLPASRSCVATAPTSLQANSCRKRDGRSRYAANGVVALVVAIYAGDLQCVPRNDRGNVLGCRDNGAELCHRHGHMNGVIARRWNGSVWPTFGASNGMAREVSPRKCTLKDFPVATHRMI